MEQRKVFVITGATAGIGLATAKELAMLGIVVLIGRNEQRGHKICCDLKEDGFEADFVRCDISIKSDVDEMAAHIEERYGRVDVLFNNAGMMPVSKEIEEISVEEWNQTFRTNLDSVLWVTAAVKNLIFKVKGCIINNASIAGMHAYVVGRSYAYSASKAAVIQLTRQMAKNYAEYGVRVNCICPGIIDTEILGDRDRNQYAERIPLGYVGEPEDVSSVVRFLISDSARYITGAVIPVDGGTSL